MSEENSWNVWCKHVLAELERHEHAISVINVNNNAGHAELAVVKQELRQSVIQIREDMERLREQCSDISSTAVEERRHGKNTSLSVLSLIIAALSLIATIVTTIVSHKHSP